MKKKLLTAMILTLAAVALVVATVFTTIAYLTASSAVSNTFTVGNVAITMFETKVDENGEPVDPKTEVDNNSYHLKPSQTYVKDPTIRVLSKLKQDEMYLFVKSSNQIRTIEAANVADAPEDAPLSMRQQMEKNGWVEFIQSGDGIEIVWVYGTRDDEGNIHPIAVNPTTVQTRGDGKTGDPGEIQLCWEFTVDEKADVSLYGAAKVSFTAFAIQTSGIDNVKDAWFIIKETFPYEGGIVNPKNPYNGAEGDAAYEPVAKVPAENP